MATNQFAPGTRVTFTLNALARMGTMTGTIVLEDGELLFMPDPKFNDNLYRYYDVEGEAGLYLAGATVTAA